jgi:transposase
VFVMERAWLTEQLNRGRSLESIAREVGRHPSTVGYWMRRYGLSSAHAERHAARGGLPREALEELVAADLTVRQIADRVERSTATVRHWLREYGLRTVATRPVAGPDRPPPDGDVERHCPRHGKTAHRLRSGGGYRCLRCRSQAVAERRRRVKEILVAEAGGSCRLCGYHRSVAALHFHHVDPAAKRFHVALRGAARSLERMRAEARKCVLVCANCHAEIEAGVTLLPLDSARDPVSGVAQGGSGPG